MWHLFLRSNRRREKQGRWSQTCISSLDSVLIHLLALTRHPRWANNTHKTRGSLKADNGNKQLRTKPAVSMNHWSWSLPPNHDSFWYHTCTPVHRSLRSWWPGKAWRYRGPGFLFSSGCWRASALVFPHHPDCYSIAPAQQELRSAVSHKHDHTSQMMARTNTHAFWMVTFSRKTPSWSYLIVMRGELMKKLLDAMLLPRTVHVWYFILRQRAVILMYLEWHWKTTAALNYFTWCEHWTVGFCLKSLKLRGELFWHDVKKWIIIILK